MHFDKIYPSPSTVNVDFMSVTTDDGIITREPDCRSEHAYSPSRPTTVFLGVIGRASLVDSGGYKGGSMGTTSPTQFTCIITYL